MPPRGDTSALTVPLGLGASLEVDGTLVSGGLAVVAFIA